MNERMYEIINQCFIGTTDGKLSELNTVKNVEKFAELIVAECLSIVKSNTYGPNGEYDYSYSDEDSAADRRAETIYEEIAYRFGVAE